MNLCRGKSAWKEVKGMVNPNWGKLTDDDLMYIRGKKQLSAGLLKPSGRDKKEAEKYVNEFLRAI